MNSLRGETLSVHVILNSVLEQSHLSKSWLISPAWCIASRISLIFSSSAGSPYFMPNPIGCSTMIIFSGCPAFLDWFTSLVMVMVFATIPPPYSLAMKAEPVSTKVSGSDSFILIASSATIAQDHELQVGSGEVRTGARIGAISGRRQDMVRTVTQVEQRSI
ncbi:hypothetical protein [Bradyrhizobium sp. SUTN9-2]|uniref:hypothetical protein n=1 Tax=Bradyrhizobium sp. SUTN9-2 TaxID=1167456 RepID=UPI001304DA07|nr:hypothetical protein [Bradyrhizobium sp. SUTN9-2]